MKLMQILPRDRDGKRRAALGLASRVNPSYRTHRFAEPPIMPIPPKFVTLFVTWRINLFSSPLLLPCIDEIMTCLDCLPSHHLLFSSQSCAFKEYPASAWSGLLALQRSSTSFRPWCAVAQTHFAGDSPFQMHMIDFCTLPTPFVIDGN